MTPNSLTIAVVLGAALSALWVDARFPRALPNGRRRLLLHLVVGMAALQAAPMLMKLVPGVGTEALPATLALLGLFFPALIYAFLSAVWVIRAAQGMLARG